MNPAERATAQLIESTLQDNQAFRQLDDKLYIIKQGSTFVMINVVPLDRGRAQVRCVAQLVKGVRMSEALAVRLLTLNATLRFGAFAFEPRGDLVLFIHSLLGGPTLDPAELLTTLSDVALLADEYDDTIIAEHGGQTMKDLIEEAAIRRILGSTDDGFPGNNGGREP
jgi:hypothetical protein